MPRILVVGRESPRIVLLSRESPWIILVGRELPWIGWAVSQQKTAGWVLRILPKYGQSANWLPKQASKVLPVSPSIGWVCVAPMGHWAGVAQAGILCDIEASSEGEC